MGSEDARISSDIRQECCLGDREKPQKKKRGKRKKLQCVAAAFGTPRRGEGGVRVGRTLPRDFCSPGSPGGLSGALQWVREALWQSCSSGFPCVPSRDPRGSPSAPRRSSRDRGAGVRPPPRASPCGDAVGQSWAGFPTRLHRRSRGLTSRARNVRLSLPKPFTQGGASARVAPSPRLAPKCWK